MEGEGEKNGLLACGNKRSPTPPFLLKTHMLVEDPATDSIISWNSQGTSFIIWQPSEFARDILPSLFKHNNFSSFIRQLNTYGFRKASSGRWEFQNNMFQRGETDLLSQIRRRKVRSGKAAPTKNRQPEADDDNGSSSTSTSSEQDTLTEENKRLKSENCRLMSQLRTMKSKCQALVELLAAYRGGKSDTVDKQHDECPKLFGVRLDIHREKKPRYSKEQEPY